MCPIYYYNSAVPAVESAMRRISALVNKDIQNFSILANLCRGEDWFDRVRTGLKSTWI